MLGIKHPRPNPKCRVYYMYIRKYLNGARAFWGRLCESRTRGLYEDKVAIRIIYLVGITRLEEKCLVLGGIFGV